MANTTLSAINDVASNPQNPPIDEHPRKSSHVSLKVSNKFEFLGHQQSDLQSRHYVTNRYLMKAIWTLLIFGAVVGFSISFYRLILRFQETPTSITTEDRSEPFIWPDITLCNSNLFNTELYQFFEFSEYDTIMIHKRFYTHFSDSSNIKEYQNFNTYRWSMFNILMRYPNYLYQPYNSILQCTFKGLPCSFLNFTIHRNPEKLNCFTFKPSDRSPGLPGPILGLNLILDLTPFFSDSDNGESEKENVPENFNGYTIAVHSPNTLPNFNKHFVEVSVGYNVDIEIKGRRTYKLNRTGRVCYERGNASLVNFNGYLSSSVSCHDAAIQRASIEQCGCQRPYRYKNYFVNSNNSYQTASTCLNLNITIPPNLEYYDLASVNPNYKINTTEFIKPSFWQTLHCYMNFSELSILMDTICPTYCNDTKYTIYSSSKQWPGYFRGFREQISNALLNNSNLLKQHNIKSRFYKLVHVDTFHKLVNDKTQSDEEGLKYLRQRFSFVRIYLGDTMMDVTREEATYTRVNLLSDIGGLMGMWIGVSFITIFDIVERVLPAIVGSLTQWSFTNKEKTKSLQT